MLGRYEEALGHYERVAPLMDNVDDRVRLKKKMGRTLFSRGEHRRAAGVLEEALALAGDRVPASRGRLLIALIRELAIQVWHNYRPRTGPLSGNPRHRLLGELYDELTHVYYFTDKAKTLHIHLRHLNFAERVQIPEIIASAYCNHGPTCALVRMFDRGIRYIEKSLSICRELGDRWGIAKSQSYMTATLFQSVRFREALQHGRAAEPAFEELGDQWELITLQLSMASAMLVLGDWGPAEAKLDRVRRLTAASKNHSGLAIVIRCRAEMVGRIDPLVVLEETRSLLPVCEEAGDHTAVFGLLYARGKALRYLNRSEEAEKTYRDMLAYKRRYSIARASMFPVTLLLSETIMMRAVQTEDSGARRRLLKEANRWHRKKRMRNRFYFKQKSLFIQGFLLNARGHFKKAVECWHESLRPSQNIVDMFNIAEDYQVMGEAYLSHNKEIGLHYLREAWEYLHRFGNRMSSERLEKLVPNLKSSGFHELTQPAPTSSF